MRREMPRARAADGRFISRTPQFGMRDDASGASASAFAPTFEDFDRAVTSALDAIDGAAESIFGADASVERSLDGFDDGVSACARAWRRARWEHVRSVAVDAREKLRAVREGERERRRALRTALEANGSDGKGTTRTLSDEVKRLSEARQVVEGMLDEVLVALEGGALMAPDPVEALEASARSARERDAAVVERDAAVRRAEAMATPNGGGEESRSKMIEEHDAALRAMEAKKRAAETSADAARAAKAAAEQKLIEMQRMYDESQSKLFELEESVEVSAARAKADREELLSLSEDLRAREETLRAASEEQQRREQELALRGESEDGLLISLREKVAVKERMVAQLASSLESTEAALKSAQEERDASTKSLSVQIQQLQDELVKSKACSTTDVASQQEIAQLKSRVKMLQEIAGVSAREDAEGADTTPESTSATALQSLRERNKTVAAELIVARRERDEAAASAELALGAQRAAERKYTEAAEMVTTLETDLSVRLSKLMENSAVNASADSDLLVILTSQRDRFKRRVSELDERVSRLEQEKVAAQDALKKQEADAVALFEKLQYAQTYYAKNAATSGRTVVVRVDEAGVPVDESEVPLVAQSQSAKNARYSCGVMTLNIEGERTAAAVEGIRRRAARYGCFGGAGAGDEIPGGDEGGVVSRYRRKYLAKLNPFAAFRARAQEESAASLPMHEKVFLKSRATRTFFSFYIIALHLYLLSRLATAV